MESREIRETAQQEMRKILQWAINEEEKAIEKLEKEHKYKGGLDGHYPELQKISEERNRMLRELQKKYKNLR